MGKEWWDEAPLADDAGDWWKDAPLADAEPKKRTWGEAAEDTGRGIMSGAAGLVKSGGDLYGLATGDMDNAASQLGRNAQEHWESGQSQALKSKKAERKAAIDAQDGIGGKAWEALKGTVTDPALAADAVATNIATLIPGMAAGRLASGAKFAAGVNAATKMGPANIPAIASAAGSFGTKAAIGVGAVQQGADVAGDVYESAMKKPDAAWAENPEFLEMVQASDGSKESIQAIKHELALKAARITLPAASAVSVAANAIPGATMLERTLVGGAARETLEQGAKLAIPKAIAKGAVGEMAQEGIEEGGGAFSGNIAKRGYVDPAQDLREGVGENAGMGMAGGFLLGGAGGAGHRAAPKPADVMRAGSVDEAIAVATASVESAPSSAIQSAGRAWQDLGVSQSGQTSSIAARQAGQEWQSIAPDQSGSIDAQRATIEREGAAASAARDSRLAEVGQQWQALGITAPQDDLQAQRAGMRPTQDGTTDGIQSAPAASIPDGGAVTTGSVDDGAGDGVRPGVDSGRVTADRVDQLDQQPAKPVASAVAFPFVKSESGTVLVTGNPVEIRAAFPGLTGATKFTDGQPSGVLFGTSAAPSVLAKLDTSLSSSLPVRDREFGKNTALLQNVVDGASAYAKGIGNIGRTKSFIEKGFDGLNTESMSHVMSGMLAISKNLKVLDSVVKLIPVDVVNNLMRSKLSPEMLFRNPSMLKDSSFWGDRDKAITANEAATAAVKAITKFATEGRFSGNNSTLSAVEGDPAVRTIDDRHVVTPTSDDVLGAVGGETPSAPPTVSKDSPRGKEVSRYTGKFGKGMGRDAARLEAQRLNRANTDKTVTYTAEEHNDPKLENPYAVVGRKLAKQKEAPALVEPAQAATETVATRRKLETIAKRLGFSVNKSTTGWHASGGMLSIPSEDADLSSAVSADHVFAHELGHGIMDKRGVSLKGFPVSALKEKISNWPELVAASKEFRPGVHGHEREKARSHAMKPNEIAADAIASVLIGNKPLTMLQPFMDYLGINKVDLGLQTVDEANAESRAAKEAQSTSQSTPTPEKPASEMSASELLRAAADKMDSEKIDDVGEKIGGARKDTAISTGAKRKTVTEDDNRPTWAKRFQIAQVAGGFDVSVNGKDVTGKWTISDLRNKDRFDQPKQVGKYFDSKEEAEAALPLIAVAQKHRVSSTGQKNSEGGYTYEIWRDVNDRKRVKVVDQEFQSREDAMRYMAQHAAEILETNTTFGEADIPKPENTDRIGVDRRTGDVKGEDFRDAFGFRGVEFGLWNNQEERQEVMNAAYDGLMDLADVLNIPPKAIGLNGDLALAFGARGKGLTGARAHYETNRVVMNLTKMNGAGALAHEWLHAFDHYLARQDGKTTAEWKLNKDGTRSLDVNGGEADMASSGFKRVNSGVREELRDAYTKLVRSLFTKAEQYVEDTARADKFVSVSRGELENELANLRKELSEQKDVRYYKRNNKPASAEQLAEFDALAAELVEGRGLSTEWKSMPGKNRLSIQTRHTNETLEKLNEIYKTVRGRSGFNTERRGVLDALTGYMRRYDQRLQMLREANSLTTKTKQVPTSFSMDAKSLDQGRGGDYWTSPHEMLARAFQGYVEDAIAAKEGRSPFLNYAPENAGIITPWGAKRPFPAGEERKSMNGEFSKFIGAIQTKETDKGVAMYSREDEQAKPRNPFGTPTTVTALQAAIKELTGLDGMNKLGRIVATTASEIKSTWEPLLGKSVNIESEGDAGAAQGFFDPKSKTIFLIADHIRSSTETAVLAHELMHKWGQPALGKDGWDRLHGVISTWANADQESNEYAVYNYARNKVEAVGLELSNQELFPYAVEAAIKMGIKPDMQASRGTVARWLESVRQSLKVVWGKITGKPETFKAQDMVNLAFGIAQMENPDNRMEISNAIGDPEENALAALSQNDETFQYPKSDKDTVEGIASDVNPAITVRKLSNIPGETRYIITTPDGNTHRMMVRPFNPYAGEVGTLYGFGLDKNHEMTDVVMERPGNNPEAAEGKDDVYIDVSLMQPGQYGAQIYSIAANYAHNTGKIFIGDPAGLSDEAMKRRVENMLSSALKFGTTDHLAPHPRQVKGDLSIGVPALDWTYGDTLANIQSLIRTSQAIYGNYNPISFEPVSGRFVDSEGAELDDSAIRSIVQERRFRENGIGVTTAKRDAVFRSLLRESSEDVRGRGGRDGVLEKLLHVRMQHGVSTRKVFYSRSGIVGQTSPHSWDAPEASKFDDLVYKLQDKQIDTKRVIEEIRKTSKALADEKDVYLQEELFHGRAAARTEDFVNNELSPLITEMKMRGIDIATLDEYLHARHAQEANDLIAERNPEIQDGGSGMTTKAARDYLDKLDPAERKRLEAVAAKVDAILGKTRQMYADYNLESQSTVNGWGQMFKHYVPLMREDKDGGMGIGQGFSIKGKETKGRTGSTRKVVDILANIAMQRERAIVRGEKNRVATALVGLAELNPNEDFWAVGPPPTEKVYDPKSNSVVERADPLFKSRENVVVAKVKELSGEVVEKAVRFNEDNERAVRMSAALKNLDAAHLNGLLGVSAKISRYFAAINTQYNPVFGVVNLVRDFQGAILNLTATPLKDKKAEIAGHTMAALKGVYLDARAARDGKPQTSAWAKLWEDFQNEGGQTGYRDMFANSTDRAKAIEHELNPTKWMDSPLGKVFTANGALKVPLEVAQKKAEGLFGWLSDYNLAMENAVRLSAYKVGLEQGMSKQQAASLAKNLTVNFNRKGQVGQQAGAVYAFFNASMQGSARLGKTLFDMDGSDTKTIRLSATGKKIVYGGVMLGVMQALLLAAAGFDDEEPPDFVRERSLIIPTGGKSYITIPMPLGLHVLPNMGRIPTEFVLGGFKQPVKSIVKLLGLTAGAFNPIGGGASLTQMLAPTAVDPLVALAENKDWTGKPIAKTSYNKATPGHALTKDTASAPSKVLAEAFNALSGGTKYTAGVFSPTPDQIDYLWGQVTGGVGRELSKAQQSASALVSGEDLPIHKIPLLGRFYGDADTQSSQSSKFYATINRLNEHESEIKGLRKDRKTAELAEYMRENPEARMFETANKVEIEVQKMRRMKREMIALDAPPERIKALEERITLTMTRFNERAAAFKKREAATAQ